MVKQSGILSKALVVGVIVLFLGVAVQPAFAEVSIKSDNSELVEITVEFYEIDKTYNHTVLLTKEQVKELENLINDFEIQLDNADSKIETKAIFKDTIRSLNALGILPKDMSIDKAQQLVTGEEHNPKMVKLLERWINKNPKSLGSNRNALCLIAGRTNQTQFFGPIATLLSFVFLPYSIPYVGLLFLFIFAILVEFFNIFPLAYGHRIGIGGVYYDDDEGWLPAEGWVTTLGLLGIKSWKGSFYGHILPILELIIPIVGALGYPGVFGFIGIKIITGIKDYIKDYLRVPHFYFGTALWVNIGEERPWE